MEKRGAVASCKLQEIWEKGEKSEFLKKEKSSRRKFGAIVGPLAGGGRSCGWRTAMKIQKEELTRD